MSSSASASLRGGVDSGLITCGRSHRLKVTHSNMVHNNKRKSNAKGEKHEVHVPLIVPSVPGDRSKGQTILSTAGYVIHTARRRPRKGTTPPVTKTVDCSRQVRSATRKAAMGSWSCDT